MIEESGLSMTQCKALLEKTFGVSVPSMSRAVDGLVGESAAQRRKLDAAIESLMDREDIAATYEHLNGVRPTCPGTAT